MSVKLPVVSGREAIGAFERFGHRVVRQRGSQVRLRHPEGGTRLPLTVPDHRVLTPGILRSLIRDAQLEVEEFIHLLGR